MLTQLFIAREVSCKCGRIFFTTHTPTFRRRIGGRPLPPPWAFTSPRLMSQVVPKPCHKRGANGLTISTHFISHYGVSKPSDFGTALQACGVSGRVRHFLMCRETFGPHRRSWGPKMRHSGLPSCVPSPTASPGPPWPWRSSRPLSNRSSSTKPGGDVYHDVGGSSESLPFSGPVWEFWGPPTP